MVGTALVRDTSYTTYLLSTYLLTYLLAYLLTYSLADQADKSSLMPPVSIPAKEVGPRISYPSNPTKATPAAAGVQSWYDSGKRLT